ncbi:hypothetical protein PLEOSDRAFT_1064574 [Pleurotus ostreatus PC15]|uniref:Amine oxidase domain-containing protein n=2 Tax=Pleurotus TaxID=5320 RepID=A0A067NS64_PLEO1|nr:hypothetical protein CCMSSC00406_0001334 [Pleurotus cornucopiae]KDQ29815.1 hypothetical protein PLEOSDRAFT_1064574 [Pleurotus ostreatus PC15]
MATIYESKYDVFAHYGRNLINEHIIALRKEINEKKGTVIGLPRDGFPLPPSTVSQDAAREDFKVGILGAGVGGLYAALILDSLDIKYEIIEASERTGGRLYTHRFKRPDGSDGDKYDYYDVGAMRFPHTVVMARLFHLFNYGPLNVGDFHLSGQLKDYYFNDTKGNNLLYYNDVRKRRNSTPSGDDFLWSELGVGRDYLKAGVEDIMQDVITPFSNELLRDLDTGSTTGWDQLMKFDAYSTRTYMSTKYIPSPSLGLPPYSPPTAVVNWCETFDKSTGWYDRSLAETVLEDMAFNLQGPWKLIDGGSQTLAAIMENYLKTRTSGSIAFNSRVTGVAAGNSEMHVSIDGHAEAKSYPHVISTLPVPCLRALDLSQCGLTLRQSNALRQLTYGPSIKIGIKFQTAWWSTAKDKDGNPLDIVGGQSVTDRPIRTIVYPSYGLPDTPSTVLIASYCWTNDAERLGALIGTGKDTYNGQLKELVLRDLATVHNLDISFLAGEFVDMYPWDWSHDPLTTGAFAFFGPGMFSEVYKYLTIPTPNGRFHFAGEALSVRHAWVVGALDSAWRAVKEILVLVYGTESEQYKTFLDLWGNNEEWTTRPANRHAAVFSTPVKFHEDMLLDHLRLNAPELFN